jgi:hypothetical protein
MTTLLGKFALILSVVWKNWKNKKWLELSKSSSQGFL